MQDARVRAALFVICLVCLIGSGLVLFAGRHAPPPVVITPPPAEVTPDSPVLETNAPAASPTPRTRVYVDVGGAVRRPSLYLLPANSRVMQAILAAGGPNGDADMDAVNLAQKVTDGEKVFIPKRNTSPTPTSGSAAVSSPIARTAVKAAPGTRSGHGGKITADSGEQVALNSATAEQLQRLPGVGPSMAERILTYREQTGGFQKVEDLMQVTGIGLKKFAKIAPFVKLD